MLVLYSALISGFFSLCLTPIVIWISKRNGWYDPANSRKIHSGKIPRLGGVAIFLSFIIAMTAVAAVIIKNPEDSPWGPIYLPFTISLIIIHAMGLVDDFLNLKARFKFIVQLCAAILVVSFGFYFRSIAFPGIGPIELGWFGYPLTLFWIVGVSNAINFIDGMDGLSGGISVIASLAFGIMYIELNMLFPALIAFTLVGAIAGFLFFNFPPAKIFMGDSGSLVLGFILAVMPLLHKSVENSYSMQLGIFSAITILIVPIFDVFAAIWRRKREGVPVMSADKWHIHHKLMRLGFSTRQILAVIYASCMLLGAIGISALYLEYSTFFIVMICTWIFFTMLFVLLHLLKRKVIHTEATRSPAKPSGDSQEG